MRATSPGSCKRTGLGTDLLEDFVHASFRFFFRRIYVVQCCHGDNVWVRGCGCAGASWCLIHAWVLVILLKCMNGYILEKSWTSLLWYVLYHSLADQHIDAPCCLAVCVVRGGAVCLKKNLRGIYSRKHTPRMYVCGLVRLHGYVYRQHRGVTRETQVLLHLMFCCAPGQSSALRGQVRQHTRCWCLK